MVLVRTENINLTHTDNFEYEQNIGQVIKHTNIIILYHLML